MAANVAPIYPKIPDFDAVAVTVGNTNSQGLGTIGTDIFLLKTAGVDGTILRRIRFMPTASVSPTNTTATVGRVFISTTSSGATSSANTHLLAEVTLAAQSANNSASGVNPVDISLDVVIPSGFSVLVTNHSAPAANTVWKVLAISSDY